MKKFLLTLAGAALLWSCGGSDDPAVITPEPIPPIGRISTYLASANGLGAPPFSLEIFSVSDTGALTPIAGSPFATPIPIQQLALHPNDRFLYGGARDVGEIDGYRIDPQTGTPVELPGFPIATVTDNSVVIDPEGNHAYVVGDNGIDAFAINQADGTLTHTDGFPLVIPGLIKAEAAAFDPSDRFLLVVDRVSDQIFVFSHNDASGALTLVAQQPSGNTGATAVGIDPSGRFVYTAGDDGNLNGFALQSNGTLVALPGFPLNFAGPGALSFEMAFYQDVIYLGNGSTGELSAFRMAADGSLSPVAGFPIAGGGPGITLFPVPDLAPFLYSGQTPLNRIAGFHLDGGGALTATPGSPYTSTTPTDVQAIFLQF